ncbi:MAG: hypothetical protein LBJ41_05890 [Treponema sp.]|nr:hypothetical protein [Treponema sp.]
MKIILIVIIVFAAIGVTIAHTIPSNAKGIARQRQAVLYNLRNFGLLC